MADAELRQNFRVCRQEKKEEAAMLRKQAIAAWRPRSKGTEKWERPRSRCQEEKKEEGIVKTNRSKAKPVSSWRCQH